MRSGSVCSGQPRNIYRCSGKLICIVARFINKPVAGVRITPVVLFFLVQRRVDIGKGNAEYCNITAVVGFKTHFCNRFVRIRIHTAVYVVGYCRKRICSGPSRNGIVGGAATPPAGYFFSAALVYGILCSVIVNIGIYGMNCAVVVAPDIIVQYICSARLGINRYLYRQRKTCIASACKHYNRFVLRIILWIRQIKRYIIKFDIAL